jgi:hypothetical protein
MQTFFSDPTSLGGAVRRLARGGVQRLRCVTSNGSLKQKVTASTPVMLGTPESYRVSEQHAPDKESTWGHAAEDDGWYKAHNSIRGEIRSLGRALDVIGITPLQEWQLRSLKAYWTGHARHVYAHQGNEDELFNPYLRTRIAVPDKLEADHVVLVALMERLGALVDSLRAGCSALELRVAWAAYDTAMTAHLSEEEQIGLPLMRAYFTPKEIGVLVEKIMKRADPIELGSFFHHMGGTREILAFMKQEGIPAIAWYLQFKGLRTAYRKAMVSHVESLIAGKPVVSVHRSREAKASSQSDENAATANPTSPPRDRKRVGSLVVLDFKL